MRKLKTQLKYPLYSFFVVCLFYSTCISGQNKSIFSDLKTSVALGGTYSYVGYSAYLTLGLNRNRHQFYLGVRNVVSKSYLFYTGPIGFKLGWNYLLSENKNTKSFINIDYQNSYNRAYNPRSIFKDKLNSVHEIFISNGLDYKISERFWIGEKIGVGMYQENLNNLSLGTKLRNFGFNVFVGLHIRYDF
jgi:hypothetical protein